MCLHWLNSNKGYTKRITTFLFPLQVLNQRGKDLSAYQLISVSVSYLVKSSVKCHLNSTEVTITYCTLSYCFAECTLNVDPHCTPQEAKLCHASKEWLYQQRMTHCQLGHTLKKKKKKGSNWTEVLLTFCLSQIWCR